jgi:hypothetical protein
MAKHTTFLSPGQRWTRHDLPGWRADLQITIVRVIANEEAAWVTYRCPNGEHVSGPAGGFEAAVAAGDIVPVTGVGLAGRC